jgi:Flp pilus assembly protein TadG
MMNFWAQLTQRFWQCKSGVAIIEFALVVPVMLLLFLGTIEVGDLLSVDKRVSSVSAALGDLVARSNEKLDRDELTDYFNAVSTMMLPYSADQLTQVVTCVFVDVNGNATVRWSEPFNGGVRHAVNSTYTLPPEFTAIARSQFVIVAEAGMAYRPGLTYAIDASFDLYRDSYYLPRFGGLISVLDP